MPRGLDHLVLATHNLDAQAEIYRRLGFTVGQRNRHPWGTLNHIVQMPGTFLELISLDVGFEPPSADEPVSQFAGFIWRYLDSREGLAMLVLETVDAAAEQSRLAVDALAGPATFHFERTGKRADGTPVHLAFTLAFAALPATPTAGFFFCQQHNPENFWSPALQAHANTATGVAAVTFISGDVARDARAMAQVAGAAALERPDGRVSIVTGRGEIEIVTRAQAETLYGPAALPDGPDSGYWAGVRFSVADLAAARRCLDAAGFAFEAVGACLVVGGRHVHGVALGFGL